MTTAVKVAKWLGLAGLAGVAATGALVAKDERKRRSYTPDEVRAKLQERAAQAAGAAGGGSGPAARAEHLHG